MPDALTEASRKPLTGIISFLAWQSQRPFRGRLLSGRQASVLLSYLLADRPAQEAFLQQIRDSPTGVEAMSHG